jgi:hypothetical protein
VSSRTVTLLGWALLAATVVVVETRALARRHQFATLGDAVGLVLRHRLGRGIVLLGWLWLGWHVFVR